MYLQDPKSSQEDNVFVKLLFEKKLNKPNNVSFGMGTVIKILL